MSMKRTAVISALWAAGAAWALRGISALVFLVLARLVDPSAFGLVALAAVYVLTTQTISDQGLATALIQRDSIEDAHKDSAFWANLTVGLLLALLTFVLADPISRLYGEPRLAPILRWFAISPVLAALSIVQQALLSRSLRFRELALRQLVGALAGGATGIAMAYAGMGVWALVAQHITNQTVSVIVLWSVTSWRPRFAFSWRHFRELFNFGFNVLAANIVRAIGFQADRLILGYFLGATALGYYSVAQRLLSILTDFVAGSAERIVVPLFARIQGEKERVNRGLMTAQRILTLVTVPAFVGLAATAPVLVPVLLGAKWQPSVLSTQILAAASLGFCLSFFFGQVLTALGRPGLRLGVVVAQALSLCAVCFIAVRFGLAGVSLAVMLNQVLFYGVELVILRRNAGFSLPAYLGEGMLPLAGSVAMAAGVILLGRAMGDFPPIAQLAADVALGMAIYGAILLIFARHRLRELLEMARGLRR
jgi:O-antigen/teichoic acid export membrane protein